MEEEREWDWYDQACEDYDQDLRAGERPDPWSYLRDYPVETATEGG